MVDGLSDLLTLAHAETTPRFWFSEDTYFVHDV